MSRIVDIALDMILIAAVIANVALLIANRDLVSGILAVLVLQLYLHHHPKDGTPT